MAKMTGFLESVVIGVLSSLVASLIFLFYLTRVRPKIEISDQVARTISASGKTIYRIKVINKSRVPIINIKTQLHVMRPTTVPAGIIYISKDITFQQSEIMELSKFDTQDKTAAYAYRFRSYDALDDLWSEDSQSYLRFRIRATHSVSGFTRVFRKDYYTRRNSIMYGEFDFGNSMKIR
ncbi:MAG: hypothetical protein ABSE72_12640 [Bacteroidales bacterium]